MFKVALVVPQPSIKLASDCSPPLGLASLAGYIYAKVKDVEVKIFDGVAGHDIWNLISMFQPDLVGITATTPQINDAYLLADSLRRNYPGITVVIGGPHASAVSEEALAHCDYVVVGEGELTFASIVEEVRDLGKPDRPRVIQGVAVDELDDLPMPAYRLLDMPFYLNRTFLKPLLSPPILGLVTSRGCPYRCVFCYNSGRSNKVRFFSAKRVAEELMFLHQKYGVCNFFFQDDEFIINHNRLIALSDLFKQLGIDKWVKWGCQARVTSLNPQVLKLMESMGCVLIVPGMESITPRVLNYLKSGSVKQTDITNAVELFTNSPVVLMGNFIVGSPSETLKEMWANVRFYVENPALTSIMLNVLTPYPGTTVWHDCQASGLLPTKMDYSLLVPTREGSLNVSTVEPERFKRFLLHADRVCFVVRSCRFNRGLRGFFGLWRAKTWWWMWLVYPRFMITLLRQSWHSKA